MKRKRHSPEQIVKHFRVAEQMLCEGKTVAQVCKRIDVTEVTGNRYRKACAGEPLGPRGLVGASQLVGRDT